MKKNMILLFIAIVFVNACTPFVPSTVDVENAKKDLSPMVVLLDTIPIVKQPTPYTCGISTFTNLTNYLKNENVSINEYINKFSVSPNHGVNPEDLLDWISKELPDYSAKYYSKLSNVVLIKYIHESLKQDFPVIVVFGSPNIFNNPYYDFHFSTVYGIDLTNNLITISNAYGFIERISLLEFQKRMLLYDINRYPKLLQQRIKQNAVSPNSIILINKN